MTDRWKHERLRNIMFWRTWDITYSYLKANKYGEEQGIMQVAFLAIYDEGLIVDVWRDWKITLAVGVVSPSMVNAILEFLRRGWLKETCVEVNSDMINMVCGLYELSPKAPKPTELILSKYLRCKNILDHVYRVIREKKLDLPPFLL